MIRSRALWIVAAIVAVAGLVFWFIRTSEDPIVASVGPRSGSISAPATQTVTLHFGNLIGPGLVTEAREVVAGRGLEERVQYAVGELLRGPTTKARPLFRHDAFVKGVFQADDGELIIDFTALPFDSEDSELTRGLAMVSLMRLLDEHFPEIRRVSLLVDGTDMADVETQLAVPARVSPRAWLTDIRVG